MSKDDTEEKPFEPTPKKLEDARKKGDIARSRDLLGAASYIGLLLALAALGAGSVEALGTALSRMLSRPEEISRMFLSNSFEPVGGFMRALLPGLAPWFAIPAACVLLVLLAERSLIFTPSKLKPKLSRISLVENAKNKFGRSGLFEFLKSFLKLILYSVCLGLFLNANLEQMIASLNHHPKQIALLLATFCRDFLIVVCLVAAALAVIDVLWQRADFLRKNRMSHKEMTDENKDSEGDPHMKQQRRSKGQEIAMQHMLKDIPSAEVVVVNPTHFAVALAWSREQGAAPHCVAKGVDEVAATIRKLATESGIPIYSDPPTARALYATTEIGSEIDADHYKAVAVAIRFAEEMRLKAKGRFS